MTEKLKEQITKDLEFLDETQESYKVLKFVSDKVLNDPRIPKDEKAFVSARIIQMYAQDKSKSWRPGRDTYKPCVSYYG